PLDVGRLLDRMDEALIPQPGGTGRFGHTLYPNVNDARRRDAALRLIATGLRTSRNARNRAGIGRREAQDASACRGQTRNERTLIGPSLAVTAPPPPPASICRRGAVAGRPTSAPLRPCQSRRSARTAPRPARLRRRRREIRRANPMSP